MVEASGLFVINGALIMATAPSTTSVCVSLITRTQHVIPRIHVRRHTLLSLCLYAGALIMVYGTLNYFRVQRCIARGLFPQNKVLSTHVLRSAASSDMAGWRGASVWSRFHYHPC